LSGSKQGSCYELEHPAGKKDVVFNQLGLLAELIRNAGKLRESVESLSQLEVEGDAGGGAVTVRVSGRLEVVSIHIEPKLVADGDAELLEDLIVAAVNSGLAKAREAAAQSLASVTGGLPAGLFPDLGSGSRGEER
jgi:DNA-binding YbaB/EbfC family protein